MQIPETARTLNPARSLTSASWIVALLVLVLNDHWLKYAALVPSWFTGKLSDFAGLYVAPALLATVLRARSRRQLLGCHVAVGLGFAAINLDADCAALCVRLMSHLGFSWSVVSDAADLIALPALLASYRWLVPHMARGGEPWQERAAQRLLAGAGLLCCMATSELPSEASISTGGPHLHNASDSERLVLVRPLRDAVLFDCAAIGEDASNRLPEAAFGVAVAYRLGARANLGVFPRAGDSCGVVLISGEGLEPGLVVWQATDNFERVVPGVYDDVGEAQAGAVVIEA
jgi:hypothetical protein